MKTTHRTLAIAAIAVLGFAACTGDPGPKRVAQDIIESEAIRGTISDDVAACMLEKLQDYSDDDLRTIADNLDSDNTERQAEGQEALAAYEADLAACN